MAPPDCEGAAIPADSEEFCTHIDGSDHNHDFCPHCKTFAQASPSSSSNSDKLKRTISALYKGFSIGAGLKGGVSLFALLVRLSRRKSRGSTKVQALSTGEEIVLLIKETLRYGFFLGTFAGTFVTVDELIATLGGHRRTARWRALLAGGIAGPAMLLTGLEKTHTSLAIYILMRAAVLASRCGIKSKRFGQICKPLTWKYGDIFLMCLSSSQILCAYILKQDSLSPSYKSFLNKHGGKDLMILQGVKDIAMGLPFSNLKGIEKYYKSLGVNAKLDPDMKVPCSIIHQNQSCSAHFLTFLFQAYKRALPVYLPVYLVPALIVHRKGPPSAGVAITSNGVRKGDLLFGDVSTKLINKNITTDIKVDTNSNVFTTVTIDEPAPGLKAIFNFIVPDQKSGKVELQYLHEYAGISTSIGLTANPVVHFSGVVGTNALALGTDLSFDTASGNLTKYNAGLSFTGSDLIASLNLNDKGDTLVAAYYHLVSPLSNTAVGGELTHVFSSNENKLTFGTQHALDPLTLVKARVDNNGKANALIQHEFRPKSLLTISGEVDTRAIEKSAKVGLALALKP